MITLERFTAAMDSIVSYYYKCDKLNDCFGEVFNDYTVMTYEFAEDLIHIIVDLLCDECELPSNSREYIEYWIYELNCGKDYKPGMVYDEENDQDIPFQTIEDLWNAIWL